MNRSDFRSAPRRFGRGRGARVALASLVCTGFVACAVGPDFHRPDPPAGESLLKPGQIDGALEADGHAQHFSRQADLPAEWWKRFGSNDINTLVEQALQNSPEILSAQATLRQSENSLRAGYGIFFPQIGASVDVARQASLTNLPPPVGHGLAAVGPYNLGTFGANVRYVPDLFGGQRRTVEVLGAQVDLQSYKLSATYLSLTSNIVNTEIARTGYLAQRDATRAIVHMLDDQIRVAQTQYEAGTGTYSAVLVLRTQQSVDEAALAALQQHVEETEHLLAQLCGQTPMQFDAPGEILEQITLPGELPDNLPSSLARHRPDILAAEAAVHAASAQIGVATADLFPSLTLGGTAGAGNSVISQMLRTGTKFWSAQADLAGSLFSGGSQWYTRKAAIDAYDASLAQYESTVLVALEQVADTMRALDHDAQALRAEVEALASAEENVKLTHANYEAGTAAYLDMLTADLQYQQARLGYLAAVAQRLQDTVALYAALGGGWWNGGQVVPQARVAGSTATGPKD